jgi:hypothetical protein
MPVDPETELLSGTRLRFDKGWSCPREFGSGGQGNLGTNSGRCEARHSESRRREDLTEITQVRSKTKVAVAAIRGDKTLAQQFDFYANQIMQWKTQLLERAKDSFETAAERGVQTGRASRTCRPRSAN